MTASRREIITSAAAGGFLAAIGLPISAARPAEAMSASVPVPDLDAEQVEWLADIDNFVRGIPGQPDFHDMIMLTNRRMIQEYPDLYSASQRFRAPRGVDLAESVTLKYYRFRYAMEPHIFEPFPSETAFEDKTAIERFEKSKAEVRLIFGEMAMLEAIGESIELQEHERRAGRMWIPYMPLFSYGIRPDPATLQHTLTFSTFYAHADLSA